MPLSIGSTRRAATRPFKPHRVRPPGVQGTVTTGARAAAGFVEQVADALATELGFDPFHGTLNLETEPGTSPPAPASSLGGVGDDHCDGVELTPCRVGGVRGAVLRPLVPEYPRPKVEVVAPVRLRSVFRLEPGDRVELSFAGVGSRGTLLADPAALDAFDAVVVGPGEAADALDGVDATNLRTGGGAVSGDQLVEQFGGLGADPGNGVYVGAGERDAAAAVDAGASFLHVDQLRPPR